ncbi:Hydrolase, TatD family [Nitrosotalea devaniterrae]|uniref:Hydrolase, TatD family n=1 Tax=Nitrosotalea devaniterrae TaxID=1078905 RepID=A0A128A555_9ARCH|nr:Hydrolase, TatD family [Candidatus Nitrosotalea devanaterra]
MAWLTDAHIHLSDNEYSGDMEYILTAMDKMKIKACCVSMDNSSSKSTLDLSQRSSLVLPFIGIHPEKADDDLNAMVDLITQNSSKLSGIGEIGLDKTYVSDEAGFSRQVLVFQELLSLAEKLDKPVSIHSRKTLDEIFSILPSYSIKGVLLHWFSGSKKQLQKAMELNCFVSYGPAMIYAGDKQVLLSETRMDKILLETDGPVKFSRCFGLKTAQITFLPSVLFCAANILRKSYDEMLLIAENNVDSYLGV